MIVLEAIPALLSGRCHPFDPDTDLGIGAVAGLFGACARAYDMLDIFLSGRRSRQ